MKTQDNEESDILLREELYNDVKKLYENDYDARLDLMVENSKKSKKGKSKKVRLDNKFLKTVSDNEFMAALTFVTSPHKIVTPEDVKKAEFYLKTHRTFRENFKNNLETAKNEKLSSQINNIRLGNL